MSKADKKSGLRRVIRRVIRRVDKKSGQEEWTRGECSEFKL